VTPLVLPTKKPSPWKHPLGGTIALEWGVMLLLLLLVLLRGILPKGSDEFTVSWNIATDEEPQRESSKPLLTADEQVLEVVWTAP
jgi:hypothetical protein